MPIFEYKGLTRDGKNTKGVLDSENLRAARIKLKKDGIISSYREGTDFYMITQRPNGDCYFLDGRTRFCTVYEKRPDTCRDFPATLGTRVGFCPAERK